MFIRNESFYTFRRSYPIITALVFIHIALFVWIHLLPGGAWVYATGVGFNLAVSQGEYWRLITPVFLHVSIGHLVFNSFALVIFGPALERMLGKGKFLFVYLLSGFIANVATYYLGGLAYPYHLGASGAIFGLFGIFVYMVIYRKDLIDPANTQLVITIIIIGLVMTFLSSNINVFAHLFGMIGGAALAPIVLAKARPFYAFAVAADDRQVRFDPNRWKKRRFTKGIGKKILWVGLGLLIAIGILSRLF
ncbi:rhomboid family intramembrane serine protease [Halalkalibacterium halodurans]|jgi:membrane associated rhomboid family serine protease|uniref:Peptidase S54 n=1 Tax=Halalkalibacterium halodurans TaxID=86665 RepID=A0A0M0KF28_ALKHA|nr:rhomboid family intramembrane serine protease [Halalkalibacterium halodurans]TPE69824.1 rhomboid family intramembrane serine protease [Halalkalibacterium halodurans]